MTNREALIAEVQISGYSENAIDKALLDLGLTGSSVYTASNEKSISIATAKVLKGMLSTKTVSEGDYSITYAIENRLADINKEYALETVTVPTIRSRNVW